MLLKIIKIPSNKHSQSRLRNAIPLRSLEDSTQYFRNSNNKIPVLFSFLKQ